MKKIIVVIAALAATIAASPAPSAEAKPHCITHKHPVKGNHKGHRHCGERNIIPVRCFIAVFLGEPVPAYCPDRSVR